jgi:Tol biopolymer transport system component/DNA-binding winged helix-turn-helix (wHTH) protein
MYAFGAFQVDTRSHELRRSGVRIKIQDQPFLILVKLLERPGQVVTREELRSALWSGDTFVDFDTGLNTAVKRLREALGDSAESPAFVETLPKLGYRFVAPVQTSSPVLPSATGSAQRELPQFKGKLLWRRWSAVTALLLVAVTATFVRFRSRGSAVDASVEVVPLTGMAEMEDYAAFSPDGNQVAFASRGKRSDGDGIYTVLIGGEKPLRLTSDPRDCCPVWSPDGRAVAFARSLGEDTESGLERSGSGYTIYTVSALGGTPRMVYSNSGDFPEHVGYLPTFSWSPDGAQLAISAVSPSLGRPAITLLSLRDLSLHPITAPPREFSDWGPAFSPDGKSLAFLRSSGPGEVDDLYMVPATGGEARRLTFDNRMIFGPPAWSPDGRDIVFSSKRAGLSTLWRIGASGGTPQRIEGVGTSVMFPAVSRNSHRLAYTSYVWRPSLWSVRLVDPKHSAGLPQLLFASKGAVGISYFSADGKKIVFESNQSGYDEIWTVNSDGSNPTQLTFLAGESGTPRWSYDGRSVAFDYRPSERSEIYTVDYSVGRPRIFPTNPGANNVTPSWSRDGHWIYFASSRGNEPIQVWKAHYPEGGTIQLTQNGGTSPVESADGFLYYSKSMNSDEIWKIPADGGPESLVLKIPDLDCWCRWALAPAGIYFIAQKSERQGTLFFYDFVGKKPTEILGFEKSVEFPAISPDGTFLIYSQEDQRDGTIVLVNNFH